MLNAVGFSSEALSNTVSLASDAAPDAVNNAPPVLDEFSHPCPTTPLFEHGHGPEVPSPKQKLVVPQPFHLAR